MDFPKAFIAVLGLSDCWAGAAVAQALLDAPAAVRRMTLPEGRLVMVSGDQRGVQFLILDQSSRTGNLADVWLFQVIEPAARIGERQVSQTVSRQTLDCAKRTHATVAVAGFDAVGELTAWLPATPAQPIAPLSAQDFSARMVCDGARPGANAEAGIIGHAAAVKRARALLRTRGKAAP